MLRGCFHPASSGLLSVGNKTSATELDLLAERDERFCNKGKSFKTITILSNQMDSSSSYRYQNETIDGKKETNAKVKETKSKR